LGGGGRYLPPHQFLLNNFFSKNRIDLKLLDFLSYTYTHPIHLKKFKKFDYSSVDNHLKLTEIGNNWATKATVKQLFYFFLFFCFHFAIMVTTYGHAIFTITFYESQVE
jgi:hypothetical protein